MPPSRAVDNVDAIEDGCRMDAAIKTASFCRTAVGLLVTLVVCQALQLHQGAKRCEMQTKMHLRKFYCPGCKELLEVEAVPPGYPILFDFLPDLDGLYGEWERSNPERGSR